MWIWPTPACARPFSAGWSGSSAIWNASSASFSPAKAGDAPARFAASNEGSTSTRRHQASPLRRGVAGDVRVRQRPVADVGAEAHGHRSELVVGKPGRRREVEAVLEDLRRRELTEYLPPGEVPVTPSAGRAGTGGAGSTSGPVMEELH